MTPLFSKKSNTFLHTLCVFRFPLLWPWCIYASPNARTGRPRGLMERISLLVNLWPVGQTVTLVSAWRAWRAWFGGEAQGIGRRRWALRRVPPREDTRTARVPSRCSGRASRSAPDLEAPRRWYASSNPESTDARTSPAPTPPTNRCRLSYTYPYTQIYIYMHSDVCIYI